MAFAYDFDMIQEDPWDDENPWLKDDPNHQPGGSYWHADRTDYDKIRADILEFLARMLWEELVSLLRDGEVPQGSGIPPASRHQNISVKTSEYVFWAKKDVRPRGRWEESPLDSLKRPATGPPAGP